MIIVEITLPNYYESYHMISFLQVKSTISTLLEIIADPGPNAGMIAGISTAIAIVLLAFAVLLLFLFSTNRACFAKKHIYEEIELRIEHPTKSNDNDPEIETTIKKLSPNVLDNVYGEITDERDNIDHTNIVEKSPTADDTIANRYIEFLICCVVEFNQQACLAILVSTDKSNAETNSLCNYLNKAIDIGVTIGITAIPGAAPFAKGAGKITGELVEGLIKEYEKSKQHKEGKNIEHLLKTFQPEDRKWIIFLLDSFSTIFIWLVPIDYLKFYYFIKQSY